MLHLNNGLLIYARGNPSRAEGGAYIYYKWLKHLSNSTKHRRVVDNFEKKMWLDRIVMLFIKSCNSVDWMRAVREIIKKERKVRGRVMNTWWLDSWTARWSWCCQQTSVFEKRKKKKLQDSVHDNLYKDSKRPPKSCGSSWVKCVIHNNITFIYIFICIHFKGKLIQHLGLFFLLDGTRSSLL